MTDEEWGILTDMMAKNWTEKDREDDLWYTTEDMFADLIAEEIREMEDIKEYPCPREWYE